MRESDNKPMKDSKHTIKLGHMATRNATHTPKKGKGSSNRKSRKEFKLNLKKGWD